MLSERLLATVVFIPILFLAVFFGGPSYMLVVTGTAILGLIEFYDLQRKRANPQYETGIIISFLLCINSYRMILNPAVVLTILLFVSFILEMFKATFSRKKIRFSSLGNITITIFGVLYVTFLLSHLLVLREIGVRFIYLLFAGTWACDTAAYFVGSRFGKHKLIPKVSPSKTVEGAIGGVIATLLVFIISRYWIPDLSLETSIILGLLTGIFALLGDLCESFMKRDAAIKDSSDFIPGHGGILDRFDSLLFTTPLVYYYLVTFGPS